MTKWMKHRERRSLESKQVRATKLGREEKLILTVRTLFCLVKFCKRFIYFDFQIFQRSPVLTWPMMIHGLVTVGSTREI